MDLKSKDWSRKEEEGKEKSEEKDRTQSNIQRRRPREDASEARVTNPQAKECSGPPGAGSSKGNFFPEPSAGHGSADTSVLTSNYPDYERVNISCLKPPSRGSLLGEPLKTNIGKF